MSTHASSESAPDLDLSGVYLAGRPQGTRWNICCRKGQVTEVTEHKPLGSDQGKPIHFVMPSLCHPHIHLDKCFLLSHPKYADLEIETGDFAEALKLTSEAKSRFEHDDLMERGRALVEESINFGVTHMRAYVEVDPIVTLKCLEAGLALKKEFHDRCYIQLCVFAQDPVVSYEDKGEAMKTLLEIAVNRTEVEVFGTTPYVEKNGDFDNQIQNIEYAIKTAMKYQKHLDFHIDYHLDPTKESLTMSALRLLRILNWPSESSSQTYRTVVFGHCTRLTLFYGKEWEELTKRIGALPISFVGLPTSDIFMMGRPKSGEEGSQRTRGTLQILPMIRKHGLNAAIGVNNVGNLFTPQGSLDPLSLASLGVGLYQASTKADVELLLQCVSNRAKAAIGIPSDNPFEIKLSPTDPANFIIFGNNSASQPKTFRNRGTTHELIYDPTFDRTTYYKGRKVSR